MFSDESLDRTDSDDRFTNDFPVTDRRYVLPCGLRGISRPTPLPPFRTAQTSDGRGH